MPFITYEPVNVTCDVFQTGTSYGYFLYPSDVLSIPSLYPSLWHS